MRKLLWLLAIVSNLAYSAESVAIIWPFNIAGAQSMYSRLAIEAANAKQNDYVFYLDNKPGAGGSIAVKHTVNSNKLTLVSHSSSFFLRPIFFPNESYNVDDVKPVLVQAINQPLAVISTKYSSLEELKKESRLTIGMQNGGITQAVSEQLAILLPNTELVFVPFNGTYDATQSMIFGHTDLSVDMLRDIRQWVALGKIKIIGLTGTRNISDFKSFKSQGITGFEKISQNYVIYTSAKVSDKEISKLHDILNEANKTPELLKFYQEDFSEPADFDMNKTKHFFQSSKQFWPTIVKPL
jgi:tripartite-type tricarboxylate transporter receptor subunit TctC